MLRLARLLTVTGGLCVLLTACGGQAAQTAQPAATDTPAGESTPRAEPTATTDANALPEDVPILNNAENLKVTLKGTYITYQAASTVEDATRFYQESLEAAGWERVNKNDSGFGDSITLLRSKPDQNIAVTLQSIPGGDKVRVLIVLSPK